MMDFLRSLAPPRTSDTTRAIPVLPPRFARGMQHLPDARPEATQALDDTDAPAPVRESFRRGGRDRLDEPRDVLRVEQAAMSDLRPPVAPPARPHAHAATTDAGEPFGRAPRAEARARATRIDPTPFSFADDDRRQPQVEGDARSRPASPLSDAALASRAIRPRESEDVIHVSIGRVDVVANATTPAPRREPARARDTVTLADYLRGNGARR